MAKTTTAQRLIDQAREWGVQLPHWRSGDGGFRSMAEAKGFAEKHG